VPDLDGFKETVTTYQDALTDLGRRLMAVVTLSLGADPADIMPGFERPTTWLRLLYYPPATITNDEDLSGSAPHCDFGALTILAQDDIGGLQVQTPAGARVNAPLIPDALMVNVGGILHRWSNGSTWSAPESTAIALVKACNPPLAAQ
jgi:isopenicillin N synthase-like dioxygenase